MRRDMELVASGELLEEDEEGFSLTRRVRIWPYLRIFTVSAMTLALASVAAFCAMNVGRGTATTEAKTPGDPEAADFIQAHSRNAEFPYGYDIVEMCGVDYRITKVLHSNLGHRGPDKGVEGIKYRASESINRTYVRDIIVWVHAKTPYNCRTARRNGWHNHFGQIHVEPGHKVKLQVHFEDLNGNKLHLPLFRMTFYDLDEAKHHTSVEYIIADHDPNTLREPDTELIRHNMHHGVVEFEATQIGHTYDNPHHLDDLSHLQQDRSVVLTYHHVEQFDVTVGAHHGKLPRLFEFCLHSALSCEKKKVARTSTTTTFTTTTLTTTMTFDPSAGQNNAIIAAIVAAGLLTAVGIGFFVKSFFFGAEAAEVARFAGTS